jgi:ribosomal protein S18 acetylase RimI-like enzyme
LNPKTNSATIVKQLTQRDVEQLQQLFPHLSDHIDDAFPEHIKWLVQQPYVAMVVIKVDNLIIAASICAVSPKAGHNEGRINDVVVLPEHRGQGFSKQLLDAMCHWLKSQNCDVVELTSNPGREVANKLYQSYGFKLRLTNNYKMEL